MDIEERARELWLSLHHGGERVNRITAALQAERDDMRERAAKVADNLTTLADKMGDVNSERMAATIAQEIRNLK